MYLIFCFFVKWYFLKVKSVKTHHGLQISIFFFFFRKSIEEKNSKMVDNLHPTEEGEAGEEPHGAPDDAQGGLAESLKVPTEFQGQK